MHSFDVVVMVLRIFSMLPVQYEAQIQIGIFNRSPILDLPKQTCQTETSKSEEQHLRGKFVCPESDLHVQNHAVFGSTQKT